MGSTLTGKNLLLGQQIISFKSWPQFKRQAKIKNGRVASPESIPIPSIKALEKSRWHEGRNEDKKYN